MSTRTLHAETTSKACTVATNGPVAKPPFVIRIVSIEGLTPAIRTPSASVRKTPESSEGSTGRGSTYPNVILFTATLPPFSSRIHSLDLSKSPPPPLFSPLPTHSFLPASEFPYSRRAFSPFPPPSRSLPSPASLPSSLWLPPTSCPARRALLTIALALSASLSLQPARELQSQTERQRQRGGRARKREGERWGWLSPVLRDAHQSTQSHGRATAAVSVKGIVRQTHSRDFLRVPRAVFPVSTPGVATEYGGRSCVRCDPRSATRAGARARACSDTAE